MKCQLKFICCRNVVYCLQCTCISGLAVDDSDGSIFISDVMSFYLYRLDKNGRLLNQLYLGAYPSVINKIGSDGHLYVTTIGSPFTLNVYTKSLTLVSSYELPPGPNYLYATIDKENNLYVQSNDPTLLYVYNKSGIFMKSINPGLKAESIFVDENDNLLASGINSKGEKLVNVVFEGTVSKSVKITEGSIGGITAYSSKVYVAQFKRNVVESFDYNAK